VNRDQIAEMIWVTWVREADADIAWSDAHLYAPEDARCVEACADAIMALDGWQKIDSAPRDGTAILAFNPAVGVYSTAFTTRWTGDPAEYEAATQGQPTYEGFPCGFWPSGPNSYPFGRWDVSPRFWRPLPQPPGDAG
jgi:hypothetical protein